MSGNYWRGNVRPRSGPQLRWTLRKKMGPSWRAKDSERRARGYTLAEWLDAPTVPATRGDCEQAARPCVHLRCRHHLGRAGELAGSSCSLDVADAGGHVLDDVGRHLGVTRERARQIERSAIAEVRRLLGLDGDARVT